MSERRSVHDKACELIRGFFTRHCSLHCFRLDCLLSEDRCLSYASWTGCSRHFPVRRPRGSHLCLLRPVPGDFPVRGIWGNCRHRSGDADVFAPLFHSHHPRKYAWHCWGAKDDRNHPADCSMHRPYWRTHKMEPLWRVTLSRYGIADA